MFGDESDFSALPTPSAPQGGEGGNRTFAVVAGILGGLIFLSLLCLAVMAFWIVPRQNAAKEATRAARETENAVIAQAITATYEASLWTPTPEPATPTPVVAMATDTPAQWSAAQIQTATVAALNTQVALAQRTPTSAAMAGTAAAMGTLWAASTPVLPQGGFADEANLPVLLLVTVVLLGIIWIVRRLRLAPVR